MKRASPTEPKILLTEARKGSSGEAAKTPRRSRGLVPAVIEGRHFRAGLLSTGKGAQLLRMGHSVGE